MATYLVNGTYLIINGVTGNAGDKQGVASIRIPVVVPDLVTAIKMASSPADVLQVMGLNINLTCMDRPFRELEDGQFQIDFAFEGFTQSQSWQQAQAMVQYRFDLEMENAPIQSNPNFQTLQAVYGWKDGAFPQTAPGSDTKAGSYKVDNNSGFSAALGCVDWMRVGGIFTASYACEEVPAAVCQGIGVISYTAPDGVDVVGIPDNLPGKFWLKLAPELDKQSNAIRVTEKTRLCTGDPTLASYIYAAGQLGG